jgi:L-ascorbate metabolism protein UlaG (beta-lactamase superfamily)
MTHSTSTVRRTLGALAGGRHKMAVAMLAFALLTSVAGAQDQGQAEAAPVAVGDPPITVTYTGNAGFLLQVAGKKIVVDSLYREGVKGYVSPSAEQVRQLENGTSPFNDINLALSTHYHADHYHPEAVGTFLTHNPQATFISTVQAREALKNNYDGFEAIAPRVRGVMPAEGSTATEEVDGIKLTILNLHHGQRREVENAGFLLEVGGRRILHMGDTEATATDLSGLELDQRNIDLAFIPFWYLVKGGWGKTIREQIAPARIVVMHLPAPDAQDRYIDSLGGWEKVSMEITAAFPNATVFRRQMDSTQF